MAKINEKVIALEEFLREKIRESIVEQMMTLTEWDPHEPDEGPEDHQPLHGAVRHDPYYGEMKWSEPDRKWVEAADWDSEFGGPRDPELDMHPSDREQMMNSLLSMEFDENKQVHMEYLNKMIREHVKRYMKASK